jgi:hypothetical protein
LRDIGFGYRPNEPVISRMGSSAARIYHERSAPSRYAGRRARHGSYPAASVTASQLDRPDQCAADIIMTGTPAGVAAHRPAAESNAGSTASAY